MTGNPAVLWFDAWATTPLAALARKLQPGPPLLSFLIELFDETESLQEFVSLIHEFLPDHYAEIMANDMEGRMCTFVHHFERRYFPIEEPNYLDEGYWPLVSAIPFPRMGIGWDDYHEFEQWQPGLRMLFALVASPYYEGEGDGRVADLVKETGGGARVPLLEDVARIVGRGLVLRIPNEGWRPEELHARLDNTHFEGVALAADWLWRQTNTFVLDITYEDDLTDAFWNRETVDLLTREWPRAQAIRDQIAILGAWLEGDPVVRFGTLVDFIRGRRGPPEEGEQMPLVEVFADGEEYEDRVLTGPWKILEAA
jgi:hypothetical protein